MPLCSVSYVLSLQVEGKLATITTQHDKFVDESEDRIADAANAVNNLEQENQQLLRQLEERQRYCTQYDAVVMLS